MTPKQTPNDVVIYWRQNCLPSIAMAYFFKVDDPAGFDAGKYLQVLALKQTTTIYAYDVPSDSSIHTSDPTVAVVLSINDMTEAEMKAKKLTTPGNSVALTKIVVRGESVGTTTLAADPPSPVDTSINIAVVDNSDRRQADGAAADSDFASELTGMNMKRAAIRVAEDQVFSTIAKNGGGDGKYGIAAGTDWCGAWAFWCYKTAAAIKNKPNPLGQSNDILLSPQKAISWAIANTAMATVLRYKGLAPMNLKLKQDTFLEVDGAHPIEPGDICLLWGTNGKGEENWRHVCLVYQAPAGDSFYTIDGNQGLPSMKIVNRSLGEKLPSGMYRHAFVTLKLPY